MTIFAFFLLIVKLFICGLIIYGFISYIIHCNSKKKSLVRELFLNNVLIDLNSDNLKYDQTYGTSDFEFISWNSFKYIKNTDRPVINSIINSRPSQVYIDIYDNSSIISNNILVFDLMKEINFIYKLKLNSFKNKIFYTEITQENTNIKENLNQLDYINLYLNNNSIFLKLKNKDISNSEIIFNYNLGTILNENEWFVLQIKLKPNINTIGTIYIQTTYNYILEVYKNGNILGSVNINFPYSYNIESYKNISKMYLQTTNIGIYNTSELNPSFSLSSVYIINNVMNNDEIKNVYNKLISIGTLSIDYSLTSSYNFNFDRNDLRIIGTSSLSNTNNIIYDYSISLPEQEIYFSNKFYNDDNLSNWMERTRSVIGNKSLNTIQMLCSHDTCSYSIPEPTYSTSNILEEDVIPIYVNNINKLIETLIISEDEFIISFLYVLNNYLNYTSCNSFPYYSDISNIKFGTNKLCKSLNTLINNIKQDLSEQNITNTNSVEKFVKGVLGSWSITQNISLINQLNQGVRYLEFNLYVDRNEEKISSSNLTIDSIKIVSTFLATSLKFNDVINDINTWLQTNSKEILILDFKDLTNITNSSIDTFMLVSPFDKRNELQKGILDKIKNTFGNKLSPNNIFPDQTYNQFINSGYRIMVCFPNNEILDEDNKKFVDRWKNNYNWINNRSEKILNTGKEIFTTIPNTLWYKTNEYISSSDWSIQYNIRKFIVLDSYGGIENLVQSELENLIINGMVNSSKLLQPKNLKELSLQFTNSFIYGCLPSPYNIDTMRIRVPFDQYNFISVDHFNYYNINSILVSLYKNELEQYVSLSKNTNEDSQCFLKDNQCYSKIGYKNDSCIKIYNCDNENETCYPICKSIDYSEPKISEYPCLRRRLITTKPNDPKIPSQTTKQYSLKMGKNINTIISTFFDITENIYEMESSSTTTVSKFYKKQNNFIIENTILKSRNIINSPEFFNDKLILGGNLYKKNFKYGLYDSYISTYNSYFGSGINLILSYQGKLFLCDNYFNTIWNDTEPVPNIYDPMTVNTANKNILKPKKISIFQLNNFNNCIKIDTIENELYKVEHTNTSLNLRKKSTNDIIYSLNYDGEQQNKDMYFCYNENLFILTGANFNMTTEVKYGLKNINKTNKIKNLIAQGKNIYLTLTDYGDLLIIDDDNNRLWSISEESKFDPVNTIMKSPTYKTSEINTFEYPRISISNKNIGIPPINNYLNMWGQNFKCKENCVMVNDLTTSHCIIKTSKDSGPALESIFIDEIYNSINICISIVFYYSSNGTLLNFLYTSDRKFIIKIEDDQLILDTKIKNILFRDMFKNQFYKLLISVHETIQKERSNSMRIESTLFTFNTKPKEHILEVQFKANIKSNKLQLFSNGLEGGISSFNLFNYNIDSNMKDNIINSFSQDLNEIPCLSYYKYKGPIKYKFSDKSFFSFITFKKQVKQPGVYSLFELYSAFKPSLYIQYEYAISSGIPVHKLSIFYEKSGKVYSLENTLDIIFLKFEYNINTKKFNFELANIDNDNMTIDINISHDQQIAKTYIEVENFLLIENNSMNVKTRFKLNNLKNELKLSEINSWDDFSMNVGKIGLLNDINKNGKSFYYVYTDNKKYLIKNDLFVLDLSNSITFFINCKISIKDVYPILDKFIILFYLKAVTPTPNFGFGLKIKKQIDNPSPKIYFIITINSNEFEFESNSNLVDIKNWSKISLNMYKIDSESKTFNINILHNDKVISNGVIVVDHIFYTFNTCAFGYTGIDNVGIYISKAYLSSGFLFTEYNSYNSNTVDYNIPNREIPIIYKFPELYKNVYENYLVTIPNINNVSISLTGNGTLSLYFFIGIYRGLNSLSFRNSEEYCSTSDMGSIFYAIYSFYKTATKACNTRNIYEWIEDRLLGKNCDITNKTQLQSYNNEPIENYPSFYELIQDYVNNPKTNNLNWQMTLNELFLNKVNLSDNNPTVLNSIHKSVFLSMKPKDIEIPNLYFLPTSNPFWLCNSQITSESIYNNIYTITPLYSGTNSEIKGLKQFNTNDSCILNIPIIKDSSYLSTVKLKAEKNFYSIESDIKNTLTNIENISSYSLFYYNLNLQNQINNFYIDNNVYQTAIHNNIIYDINKLLNTSSNKKNTDIELSCKIEKTYESTTMPKPIQENMYTINSFNLKNPSNLDPLGIYSLLSRGVKKIFCFTSIYEDNKKPIGIDNIFKNYFKDPIYKVFDDTNTDSILNSIYNFLYTTSLIKECPTYVKIKLNTVPNIYLNIKIPYELELFLIADKPMDTSKNKIIIPGLNNYVLYDLENMNKITSSTSNMFKLLKNNINNFYLNSHTIVRPQFNFDFLDYCTYLIYKNNNIFIDTINMNVYTSKNREVRNITNKINELPSIHKNKEFLKSNAEIKLNYTISPDNLFCYSNTIGIVFEIPKQVISHEIILFDLNCIPPKGYVNGDNHINFTISIDKNLEIITLNVNKITSFIKQTSLFSPDSIVGVTTHAKCELPFVYNVPIILFARYDNNYLSLDMYWTYNKITYNSFKTIMFESYCFKAESIDISLGISYKKKHNLFKILRQTAFEYYISELIIYTKSINENEYTNLKNHLLKKWNFKNVIPVSSILYITKYYEQQSIIRNLSSTTNSISDLQRGHGETFEIRTSHQIGKFNISEKGFSMFFVMFFVMDSITNSEFIICNFSSENVFSIYIKFIIKSSTMCNIEIYIKDSPVYTIQAGVISGVTIVYFNCTDVNAEFILINSTKKIYHSYNLENKIFPLDNHLNIGGGDKGAFYLYEYLFFVEPPDSENIFNILTNLSDVYLKDIDNLPFNLIFNFDTTLTTVHTFSTSAGVLLSSWTNLLDNKIYFIDIASNTTFSNKRDEILPIGITSFPKINIPRNCFIQLENAGELLLTEFTIALVLEINEMDENSVLIFIGKKDTKDIKNTTIFNCDKFIIKNGEQNFKKNGKDYDFSDTLSMNLPDEGTCNLPKVTSTPLILLVRIKGSQIYFEQTTCTNKVPKISISTCKFKLNENKNNILCIGGIFQSPYSTQNDISISQFMLYDRALNKSEIERLRNYLSDRWKFYN